MPHDTNQDLSRLDAYLEAVGPPLGIDPGAVPIPEILGLSTDVARAVMRPGVPVSAFVLGLAVGRGMDPAEALRTLRDGAAAFEAEHGPDPSRRH
ncbi:DUF6457 domain-containing protein [Mariniluteicoccus flavus]